MIWWDLVFSLTLPFLSSFLSPLLSTPPVAGKAGAGPSPLMPRSRPDVDEVGTWGPPATVLNPAPCRRRARLPSDSSLSFLWPSRRERF